MNEVKIIDLPERGITRQDYALIVSPDGTHNKGRYGDIIDETQRVIQENLDSVIETSEAQILEVASYTVEAKNARDDAILAASAAGSSYEPKGNYNAATNTPTLSADATIGAGSKPQQYVITTAGNLVFATVGHASGYLVNVGDKLNQHPNGSWFVEPASDAALVIAQKTREQFKSTPEGSFKIVDGLGYIGLELTATGKLRIDDLEIIDQKQALKLALLNADKLNGVVVVDEPGYALLVRDESGNIGFAITDNGEVIMNSGKLVIIQQEGEVIYICGNGQSLSIGTVSPGHNSVVSNTATPFIFMFNSGIIRYLQDANAGRWASLVGAVESGVETPVSGFARQYQRGINNRGVVINGTDFVADMICSAEGVGSSRVEEHLVGTANFTRWKNDLTNAKRLATEAGKTFWFPYQFWMQGEANYTAGTSKGVYMALLRQLRNSHSSEVKTINPSQKRELKMLTYQIASHNKYSSYPTIALAQLDLALNDPNFYMGPVMYQYVYGDDIHLSNGKDYHKCGMLFGYIADQIDLGIDWKPIHPISSKIEGKWLDLTFHVPHGKLAFETDTAKITDPGNKGFRLFNTSSVEQTITSVRIINKNTVRIESDVNISKGSEVTYAINGTALKTGPFAGARGLLRDTLGDVLKYDPTGLNEPVHNFCPIFTYII